MSTVIERMIAAYNDEYALWEILKNDHEQFCEVVRWHSDPCDDDYDVKLSCEDGRTASDAMDGLVEVAAMKAALRVALEPVLHVDADDWSMLKVVIDDSGHGKFWKAVLKDFRPVVEEAR